MNDPENTTPEMLMRAAEIGQRNGLRYVYAGNIPGRVGDLETHALPQLPRDARRALWLLHPVVPPDARRHLPGMRNRRSRAAGDAQFEGQIASMPFLPGRRRLRVF